MKSLKNALLYGFFIWIIVFVVAFLVFPIHESNRPFFESIMPVAISVVTVFFSLRYFKTVEENFVKEGYYLGIVIIVVNWILDAAVMLTPSPMQMSLDEYISDIGFTYFMILPITAGLGMIARKTASSESEEND